MSSDLKSMLSWTLNLILEGGPLLLPILVFGLIGLWAVFERRSYWSKMSSTFNADEVERTYTLWAHKQFESAKEILEASTDPSLKCLKHCLVSKGKIHPQILQSLGQQLLDQSRKKFRLLELVVTVSPLLGILGTILGIIVSIKGLNHSPENLYDPQVMISGLSQALVTTAFGLSISIFHFIFYSYFNNQFEKLKSKLERDLSAFESLV